jgi:hypothetical protein
MTRRNPRARTSSLGTTSAGILGVFPQEPEIVGVFPKLSASFMPHGQEIRFHRGDSFDIPILVQDDQDPPDPIMLDGAVLRWAAKQNPASETIPPSDVNLLIRKASYDESEIEFTNPTNGRAVLKIDRDDTADLPQVSACWDLEVTVPTEEIAVPVDARATTVTQSPTVSIVGVNLMALGLRRGDILDVAGSTRRRVLVKKVLSPSMVETEFNGWVPETGLEFCLFRASTRTVASGPFKALLDIA